MEVVKEIIKCLRQCKRYTEKSDFLDPTESGGSVPSERGSDDECTVETLRSTTDTNLERTPPGLCRIV